MEQSQIKYVAFTHTFIILNIDGIKLTAFYAKVFSLITRYFIYTIYWYFIFISLFYNLSNYMKKDGSADQEAEEKGDGCFELMSARCQDRWGVTWNNPNASVIITVKNRLSNLI